LGDVELALVSGAFGYVLRKLNFPLAPLVIAYIITPMAERSFKQAMLLSDGDYSVFFTKPISLFFIILAAIILVLSVWKQPKVSAE
jgi:putative tricarboxylic transport membrane protein